MDDQRDTQEERYNADLQATGDGEVPVRRAGDDEIVIDNAIDGSGFKLRLLRVRGILHIGVEDRLGNTTWTDTDLDHLQVGLRMLGIEWAKQMDYKDITGTEGHVDVILPSGVDVAFWDDGDGESGPIPGWTLRTNLAMTDNTIGAPQDGLTEFLVEQGHDTDEAEQIVSYLELHGCVVQMAISDYDHHGEEAPIVWAAENDFDSPMADMTDREIKQAVYDRMNDPDYDDDHPEGWE